MKRTNQLLVGNLPDGERDAITKKNNYRSPKERLNLMNGETKTTVLISYNRINGFCSGWHADGKVYVCANDAGRGCDTGEGKDYDAKASSVMHKLSGQYYHGAVPIEQVKRYYVYAGLHAMRQAIDMAKDLRSRSQAPVTVVACDCDAFKKTLLLVGTGIRLIWCGCGGETGMGRLAEVAVAE